MGLLLTNWTDCTATDADFDRLIVEVNRLGDRVKPLFIGDSFDVFDLGDCPVPEAFDRFDTTYFETKEALMAGLEAAGVTVAGFVVAD